MMQLHYSYYKPRYGDRARVCFTDTDSLLYHITTENLLQDMVEDTVNGKQAFDLASSLTPEVLERLEPAEEKRREHYRAQVANRALTRKADDRARLEELKGSLPAAMAEAFGDMFREFDVDGNGILTRAELVDCLGNLGVHPTEDELTEWLSVVDDQYSALGIAIDAEPPCGTGEEWVLRMHARPVAPNCAPRHRSLPRCRCWQLRVRRHRCFQQGW